MSDYISEKIEQYERKLKQAEKAGKHNKAKKYQGNRSPSQNAECLVPAQVTLALRKARKARKRAVKWFAETFDDSEDEGEDEPLGPNMDANEDLDDEDQLENGQYTFSLKDDGTGVVAKDGQSVWTTAELDFDPYSEGVTTGGNGTARRDPWVWTRRRR